MGKTKYTVAMKISLLVIWRLEAYTIYNYITDIHNDYNMNSIHIWSSPFLYQVLLPYNWVQGNYLYIGFYNIWLLMSHIISYKHLLMSSRVWFPVNPVLLTTLLKLNTPHVMQIYNFIQCHATGTLQQTSKTSSKGAWSPVPSSFLAYTSSFPLNTNIPP